MKATQSEIDKILPLLEATPRQILAALAGIGEETLNTRPDGINGREHTIFSQARRMAKHEQEHREQIERIAADMTKKRD